MCVHSGVFDGTIDQHWRSEDYEDGEPIWLQAYTHFTPMLLASTAIVVIHTPWWSRWGHLFLQFWSCLQLDEAKLHIKEEEMAAMEKRRGIIWQFYWWSYNFIGDLTILLVLLRCNALYLVTLAMCCSPFLLVFPISNVYTTYMKYLL
jgi:hypothetical protein